MTYPDGHQEVEEWKGYATQEWKIKRDLFIDNYPDIPYNVITQKRSYYFAKKA